MPSAGASFALAGAGTFRGKRSVFHLHNDPETKHKPGQINARTPAISGRTSTGGREEPSDALSPGAAALAQQD